MSSSPKPAPKQARAASPGARGGDARLEAFDRLASGQQGPETASLSEVAALQRWTNAGRMVASAAHEMRGALAAAQMNLEFLTTELRKPAPQQAPEEISQAADDARQGILRALSATQSVLSLALATAPSVMPLSAIDAVERAVAAVAPRLRGLPSVEVSAEPVPLAEAEPGALHQALVALLLNAADAIGERRAGRVRVCVTAGADLVRISVLDSGSPRGPDQRGVSASAPRRSCALGLSLSQALVQSFGGALSGGEGGPLGGSEFTLLLPQVAKAI